MKRNVLKIPLLLSGVLALTALTSVAEPFDGVRNLVMQAGKESEKGVIMVVSERGSEAVDAAYMLSDQMAQNPGYKPLLMVPKASEMKASLQELALTKDALPAVIIFTKTGEEVARIIDVAPSSKKIKTEAANAEVTGAKLGAYQPVTTTVKG